MVPVFLRGKINGKSAEMVVDSGCNRTLIHKRYSTFTGDKITVLTATGEPLSVPIANVEFDSKEGKHLELVGVLDTLGACNYLILLSRRFHRKISFWFEFISNSDPFRNLSSQLQS